LMSMTTKRKRSAVSNRNATSELSDGPADLLGRFCLRVAQAEK
jgi:hypothetical protein